jgi:tetratricopeptide (TPR) repeat protein
VSSPVSDRTPGKARRRSLQKIGLAATGMIILGLLGWGYSRNWFRFRASPEPARRAIAVVGFEDVSASPGSLDLSNAFTIGLAQQLSISEGLRVVPGEQIAHLQLSWQAGQAWEYSHRTLSLIRENTGADLALWGSYYVFAAGSGANRSVRLNLSIAHTLSGALVAEIQRNGDAGDLIRLIEETGGEIRAKLHLSPLSSEQRNFSRAILPANSDALLSYANGLAALYRWRYQTACHFLERAITSDPAYALAHAALARALAARGLVPRADAEIREAVNLAHSLPRKQRLLVEAEYYELEAEPSKAIETYKRLFERYPEDLEAGLALAKLQPGEEAVQTLETLQRLPRPLGDDPRIDALKAAIELRSGRYAAARLAAESAVIQARERGSQDALASALVIQAQAENELGQRQRAASLYWQAEQISRRLGDEQTEAMCLENLADMAVDAGELDVAAVRYQRALEMGRRSGLFGVLASAARGVGRVRLEQGRLDQAQQNLEQSLNLWREQQDYREIPLSEIDLGELYLHRGELEKGSQTIGDALKALENTHGASQAEALEILARIRMEQGRLGAATQTINEALQIARNLSQRYPLARILLTAGSIAREQASLDEASERYSESLRLFSALKLRMGIAEARSDIARIELDRRRRALAIRLAHEALVEFERENSIGKAAVATALLAEAELLEGHIAVAEMRLRAARRQRLQDRLAADLLDTVAARLEAMRGNRAHALSELRSLVAETTRLGLVADRLRVELALATVDPKFDLAQLISEASQNGFQLIAKQAGALRPAKDAATPEQGRSKWHAFQSIQCRARTKYCAGVSPTFFQPCSSFDAT